MQDKPKIAFQGAPGPYSHLRAVQVRQDDHRGAGECHKDLKVHLEGYVREAREKCIINATFVRGLRGRPLGERYFATRWDAIAARTSTAHLNRQDLRRTEVIRLAEASCPEIASITGHTPASTDSILQTYLVTTYEMADAAITKLEQSQDRRRERMTHESQGRLETFLFCSRKILETISPKGHLTT